MSVSAEIRERLVIHFDPQEIEIVDESESHRGHAGYQEGGESHFRVRMVSKQLSGMSRLARHRAAHEAIGKDLIVRIHALTLDLSDQPTK